MNLVELQVRQNNWQQYNFPDAEPHQPLLGLVEELGELITAHENVVIGLDYEKWEGERIDAVGDMMIFLAGYCNLNGINLFKAVDENFKVSEFETISLCNIFPETNPQEFLLKIQKHISRLSHTHLKKEQGIRSVSDECKIYSIALLVVEIASFCVSVNLDFWMCIETAWKEVEKRDWKKNKENGK